MKIFFQSSVFTMLAAGIFSLVTTLLLGPKTIQWLQALKIKNSIRTEECPKLASLHQVKSETPTMGGALIVSVILFSSMIWLDWSSKYVWILFWVTLGFGCIGFIDDYFKLKNLKGSQGISGKRKFYLQVTVAFIACLAMAWPILKDQGPLYWVKHGGVYLDYKSFLTVVKFPFIQTLYWFPLPCFFLLGIFVITGSSNAVNLTDGLDGLASGTMIFASIALALYAYCSSLEHLIFPGFYVQGSEQIAIFLSIVIGSCLGFLHFNAHPAKIFMGDTGSLPLGAILGIVAVLLRQEFLLAVVGGVFVLEAMSVMLQVSSFKLRKKKIFLCSPIHHHFEYLGWKETKVVTRFWLFSVLLAVLGIASFWKL